MTKKHKKMLHRLILSGCLYIIGIIFRNFLEIEWLEVLFLFGAYLVAGYDVLLRACKNIKKGQVFDENFLMAIATIGAILTKEYPEAAAVMLFYQVGELFQGVAVERSRKSISALMDLYPDEANLIVDQEIRTVMPEEVKIGDKILVRPGEKIPLDGVIIEGKTMVDTSMLTGEPVPKEVQVGDMALSGCVNQSGTITIEVNKEFYDSTVAKILELVESASSKKAKSENFITRFARYYTPAVVIGALILAFLPPILLGSFDFPNWIHRALIFLVVSCPCALVISVPLSFFGGIGAASRQGILVKGSNYLELLASAKVVMFDKTGTLTKGSFQVTEMFPTKEMTKEQLLEYAAYGEIDSSHPIGISIKTAYEKELERSQVEQYEDIAGFGTKSIRNGKTVLVGNYKLMDQHKVPYMKLEKAGTIVYVAVDGTYLGAILIGDEIKEDSKATIAVLKAQGCTIVMLTGDIKQAGESVAKELGIEKCYTDLLPTDKAAYVEKWLGRLEKNQKLVFVGDGMNDAPVLARADIGVAMGGLGSDAAIEAADVVIMDDQPSKLVVARKIAKKTVGIVKQNIILALGIKALVLILAAFGDANMWEAVFADVGVAVLAILNAMRLLRMKEKK